MFFVAINHPRDLFLHVQFPDCHLLIRFRVFLCFSWQSIIPAICFCTVSRLLIRFRVTIIPLICFRTFSRLPLTDLFLCLLVFFVAINHHRDPVLRVQFPDCYLLIRFCVFLCFLWQSIVTAICFCTSSFPTATYSAVPDSTQTKIPGLGVGMANLLEGKRI